MAIALSGPSNAFLESSYMKAFEINELASIIVMDLACHPTVSKCLFFTLTRENEAK